MKFYLKEFTPGQYGYDLEAGDGSATLGDYVEALDAFQEATMADCRGCDACCYERIPLTIADFAIARPWVAERLQTTEDAVTLTHWLTAMADIRLLENGAIDIILKRQADYGCHFLNRDKQECAVHPYRPLVCRTHCCLPKSEAAIALRSDIINAGEDELCRQLLALPEHPWQQLLTGCRREDYPASGFSQAAATDWRQIPLKTISDDTHWLDQP